MIRYVVIQITALCLAACSVELAREASDEASDEARGGHQGQGTQLQGTQLQGTQLQGIQLQGMTLQGFRFNNATLNGAPLNNLRIDKGELVAEQNQVTLRNTALVNAHIFADARNRNVSPPQTATVEFKIDSIVQETNPAFDPTGTGNTYLYTISQNVNNTGTYQPACPIDSNGSRAAIPLADTWDESGNRNSAAPWFTLACTVGAIAKCYRWGYRPWVTGYGNLKIMHQTCTRVARADYCGDGISHTMNNTQINIWDSLSAPGPIQAQGTTPAGMTFEAAWDPNGALCFSHARWNLDGATRAAACPNRLQPPGQNNQPGTVCDSVADVLMQSGNAPRLYNESVIGP